MSDIKVDIYIADISAVIALYDVIQVFRSEDGTDYEEITTSSPQGANIVGTEEGPFDLNGTTFRIKVDGGDEQEFTFNVADPIAVDDVVDEINNNVTGVTSSVNGSSVEIESDTVGTGSSLELTSGTSLDILGFDTEKVNGKSSRISLLVGVNSYEIVDEDGDTSYYYKSRCLNSGTSAVSDFSEPIQGVSATIVGSAHLVKGSATLANIDGSPLSNTAVAFQNVYSSTGFQVGNVGVVGSSIVKLTDNYGYVEAMLVSGSIVDVSIAGTAVSRRITVPDSDFNLMDSISSADDLFQIHTSSIASAPRRS